MALLGSDLIILHTEDGRKSVYTRSQLEALTAAGILPSHIGYEDPDTFTNTETEYDEELYMAEIFN